MNEPKIQNALWLDRGRAHALVCPNYTPSGWFECDMWMVTKAGYATEFEIKLSAKDFKIDGQKAQRFYPNSSNYELSHAERWKSEDHRKHDLLAAHDPRGPSRFFFVVSPEVGLTADNAPAWAGVILAEMVETWNGAKRLVLRELKAAPKLHGTKVNPKIIDHCRGVFFYRYWNIRTREKAEKWLTDSLPKAEDLIDGQADNS